MQTVDIDLYLPTKAEIEKVHQYAMEDQGTTPLYLNESYMESAVGAIKTALLYMEPIHLSTAAALCAERVAEAHAFQDGNKRAGYAAMEIFLAKCNKGLSMSDKERADFMVDLVDKTKEGRRSREELLHEIEMNIYSL